MKANYCTECGVEGIPDRGIPDMWKCPQCHRLFLAMNVAQKIPLKDALGTHSRSQESHGVLPVRESARHVAEDGSASAVDIVRYNLVASKVERSMQPASPAPRDPQGARKRSEELQAVRILLPSYNKLHGTTYESLTSGIDEHGDDVIAESSTAGEVAIRFQLTFAESNGTLRASISRGNKFSRQETEEELLARAAGALRKKSLSPDRKSILVLDGAGIITSPGTVDRFAKEYVHELTAAPFREVWWVDHAPGGVIRRLWPDC